VINVYTDLTPHFKSAGVNDMGGWSALWSFAPFDNANRMTHFVQQHCGADTHRAGSNNEDINLRSGCH
jgi:hypothetical protein